MTEDSSSSCSEPVLGNDQHPATGSGKCPYAALALSVSSLDSHNNTVSSSDQQQQHGLADVSLTSVYEQCPAFQNGSCPFKDKKDAEAVRQTLLQIPSSHLEKDNHQFYHVLQQLHNSVDNNTTNSGTNENGYHLPGGCPIASNQMAISKLKIVFKNNNNSEKEDNDNSAAESQKKPAGLSFTEAMESYSLASIMARMASIHEDDFDSTNNEQYELDSVDKNETLIVEKKESDKPKIPVEKSTATNETVPSSKSISPTSAAAAAVKLSECFKTGTIESHQAAEDVHFVKNFIRGEIDRDLYKDLILQLYFVYDALEGSLLLVDSIINDENIRKQQENAPIDKFCLEAFLPFHEKLQRKDTLIEDLDFWFGTNVAEKIVNGSSDIPVGQSDACKEYVERIRYLAANEPVLLLAHSYTRYLGDLSGGKVLARVAKRALNLTSSSASKHGPVDGLAFYDFTTTIPSAKKFKDEYKNALDSLPLSREQISRLVQEANVAFVLNMRLFEELDVKAGVPNATVRSYEEALQYGTKNYIIVEEDENDNKIESVADEKAKCPFAASSTNKTSTVHYSKTNFSKISGDSKSTTPNGGSIEQCPFAKVSGSANGTASEHNNTINNKKHVGGGRCPWPFIFAHDPIQGLRDWQTWALLGLILSYIWYTTLSSSSAHITA